MPSNPAPRFAGSFGGEAAASEESLAGRDALVALVRLLARQAAREALIASRVEQENQNHEKEE